MKTLTIITLIIYIVFTSFIGLTFGFADLGSGETQTKRFITEAIYFFMVGGIIGLITPKYWKASIFIAAIGVLFGLLTLFGDRNSPEAGALIRNIISLLLPLLTIVSSYLITKLRTKTS